MSNKSKEIAMDSQVKEQEFSEEQTKNQIRLHEEDFLQGLLLAAEYKDDESELVPIEINRSDKLLFSFRIRPLGESEYDECKKRHTRYVRNKQLGIRLPEDTNSVKYRCELIYHATVEEDRNKLWDNKLAWEKLNAKGGYIFSGIDVIEHVLKAGEKDRVVAEIDRISAYDSNLEEVAKN